MNAQHPRYTYPVRVPSNEFGQPVGAPVVAWTPCPVPAPDVLAGEDVRLVPLTHAHVPGLFAATCADGDAARWPDRPDALGCPDPPRDQRRFSGAGRAEYRYPVTSLVRTRAELHAALAELPGSRALVMTMGALHEGHLTLVAAARELADHVVASVYVNPLQFGPHEDFDAYPRDLDADLALLRAAGVAVVYAPDDAEMYPGWPARPLVTVDPGPVAAQYEGRTRPGHFAGVLQVVAKVISLVRPDVSVFGQKDAQQLALVRTLVRDLDLPGTVHAVPISRDTDGLARSSRNTYLSAAERGQALALSRALRAGEQAAAAGVDAAGVLDAARAVLDAAAGVDVDYLALVDPVTFEQVGAVARGARAPGAEVPGSVARVAAAPGKIEAVLAVAAGVGTTRLIDNVPLTLKGGPA